MKNKTKQNKTGIFALVITLVFGMVIAGCSDGDDGTESSGGKSDSKKYPKSLTVKSDGEGMADTLITAGSPSYETTALKIKQVVPDFSTALPSSSIIMANASRAAEPSYAVASTSNTWPANSPIIVFFDDIIYQDSIANNFEIKVGSERVYGNINIGSTPDGKGNPQAILTFTPYKPFDTGKGVTITIKQGLQDKCGNAMSGGVKISFTAKKPVAKGNFDVSNWGFEKGMDGIEITGDGIIFEGNGSLVPHGGNKLAAISTGKLLSNTQSIENKSSFLKLGPIDTTFSKLTLWYDYISAEFNTYVGTQYNDEAVITIYGPNGTVSKSLTSINTEGAQEKGYTGTLYTPEGLSAKQTGWKQFDLNDINVGAPAYVIFTVSDIGDTIYSTILAVDDLVLSK